MPIAWQHIPNMHQWTKWEEVSSLQPPAHVGSSLVDFSTLKIEAIRSSETPVHTRSTRHHIPEDGILHGRHSENLKFYKICWKEVKVLQIEPNTTYRKCKESTHISDRPFDRSIQLGQLSHLDSCYHIRSQKTTTPSSVD
jgi:hypothetical protein